MANPTTPPSSPPPPTPKKAPGAPKKSRKGAKATRRDSTPTPSSRKKEWPGAPGSHMSFNAEAHIWRLKKKNWAAQRQVLRAEMANYGGRVTRSMGKGGKRVWLFEGQKRER